MSLRLASLAIHEPKTDSYRCMLPNVYHMIDSPAFFNIYRNHRISHAAFPALLGRFLALLSRCAQRVCEVPGTSPPQLDTATFPQDN